MRGAEKTENVGPYWPTLCPFIVREADGEVGGSGSNRGTERVVAVSLANSAVEWPVSRGLKEGGAVAS